MEKTLYEVQPNIKAFHSALARIYDKGSYFHYCDGRPFNSFTYVVEGHAICDFGTYQIEAKAGDLLFWPKGSIHSVQVLERYHIVIANFFLDVPEVVLFCNEKVTPISGASIEHTLRKILAAWQMQPPTMNTDCMSLLYSVYSAYLTAGRSTYLPSQKRYHMEQAIQYIEKHIAEEDLCVQSIAKALKMSESHFRHSFKEVHNVSPARYISLKRIQIAKRLLNTADEVSVEDVARQVGFSSIYYFSSAFKKEVKCSPTEWRKKRQINI